MSSVSRTSKSCCESRQLRNTPFNTWNHGIVLSSVNTLHGRPEQLVRACWGRRGHRDKKGRIHSRTRKTLVTEARKKGYFVGVRVMDFTTNLTWLNKGIKAETGVIWSAVSEVIFNCNVAGTRTSKGQTWEAGDEVEGVCGGSGGWHLSGTLWWGGRWDGEKRLQGAMTGIVG